MLGTRVLAGDRLKCRVSFPSVLVVGFYVDEWGALVAWMLNLFRKYVEREHMSNIAKMR